MFELQELSHKKTNKFKKLSQIHKNKIVIVFRGLLFINVEAPHL